MAIQLFDSLSREIRELRASHDDGVFRFYNCGPTVYAPAHIGTTSRPPPGTSASRST